MTTWAGPPPGATVIPKAVNADGSTFLGLRKDSEVTSAWRWTAAGGHSALTGISYASSLSAKASADATVLAVKGTSSDAQLALWDGTTHRVATLTSGDSVMLQAVSPDGNYVVVSVSSGSAWTHQIYGGVLAFIATGAAMSRHEVFAPAGYNAYLTVAGVTNTGIVYGTARNIADTKAYPFRSSASSQVSIILTAGVSTSSYTRVCVDSSGADAASITVESAALSGYKTYYYTPGGGALDISHASGALANSIHAGVICGGVANATGGFNPARWSSGSGWQVRTLSGVNPSGIMYGSSGSRSVFSALENMDTDQDAYYASENLTVTPIEPAGGMPEGFYPSISLVSADAKTVVYWITDDVSDPVWYVWQAPEPTEITAALAESADAVVCLVSAGTPLQRALGVFARDLVPTAWLDAAQQPIGWFSSELVFTEPEGAAVTATIALSESADTVVATALLVSPVLATTALTEAADTLSSQAGVVARATTALTEAADTLSSQAGVDSTAVSLVVSVLEMPDTLSSQAGVAIGASSALPENSDTGLGSVSVALDDTIWLAETEDVLVSVGSVTVGVTTTLTETPDILAAGAFSAVAGVAPRPNRVYVRTRNARVDIATPPRYLTVQKTGPPVAVVRTTLGTVVIRRTKKIAFTQRKKT